MKKYLVIAAIVAVGTTLLAEEKLEGTKLDETVISTENFETNVRSIPANVSIITNQELIESGAKDLVDALKNVPGVRVTRYAGTIKFDIRGLNSMYSDRNALITLDGVPVEAQQISNLPMNMIEKIEIIPGGGNILYGDKAIGGIVNVITKSTENRKNYGSLFGELGNHSSKKMGVNFGTKVKNILVDGGYISSKNDGWRDHENFENDTFNIKVKYLLENGDVEYKYTYTEDKDLKGVAVPRVVDRKDPGKIAGGKYKSQDHYIKYRKDVSDNLEFLLYGNYYEKENDSFKRYKNSNYYGYFIKDNDEIRKYIKSQIKYKYSNKNYTILGMDYLDERLKPAVTSKEFKEVTGMGTNGNTITGKKWVETGESKKENFGVFLSNHIFYNKFQFIQGIRYDKAEYDFYWRNGKLNSFEKIGQNDRGKYENYSLELAMNYDYSDSGMTYLSYNRAFRTPTVGEMRYTRNSEKLKPQVQDTIELGVKDYIYDTFISASTFYKKTQDEIYSAIPPEFTGMVNYNIGTTERIGVEIYAEHYIGKATLKGSATYLKTKVIDGQYAGVEIPSVPSWKLSTGLKYDFTDKFSTSIDMLYYSDMYDLDDLENKRGKNTGGYTTFDISSYYKVNDNLMLTARIENIFDKKYDEYAGYWDDNYDGVWKYRRQYYPAIGRTITAGFIYSF